MKAYKQFIDFLGGLGLLLFFSPHTQAFKQDPKGIYFIADSYSFSEIAPIKQTANGLDGPNIDKGEVIFTYNYAEAGQLVPIKKISGNFSYGIFSRRDYYLKFTPDTASFVYADQNDISLPTERAYIINLHANSIAAQGIRLGYIGSYRRDIRYQAHISYLRAIGMTYGRLNGNISGEDNLSRGNLALDYQYSEDVFFDRAPNSIVANGFNLDVYFSWQLSSKVEIIFQGKDIFSEIYWKNQHRTTAQASSDRIQQNDASNLIINPILSWTESRRSITQSLPKRLILRETYQLNIRNSIGLTHFRYDDFLFHKINYTHRMSPKLTLHTSYDFVTGAVGLGVDMQRLQLNLVANDTSLSKTKVLGLKFGVNIPL